MKGRFGICLNALMRLDEASSYDEVKKYLQKLEQGFDGLLEGQKVALLKEALNASGRERAGEFISKRMGCSVTSKKGFKEILPLIEKGETYSWRFAERIAQLDYLGEEVESRFGKVHTLIALSKSTIGLEGLEAINFESKDKNLLDELIEDFGPFYSKSKFLYKSNLEWIRFLSEGEDCFLRKERREVAFHKSSRANHKEGLFNEMAKCLLPLTHIESTRGSLRESCKRYPQEMRSLATAIYFDSINPLTPNSRLFENVWLLPKEGVKSRCWIKHLDVFLKENILTSQEAFCIFCNMLKAPKENPSFMDEQRYRELIESGEGLKSLKKVWELIQEKKDYSPDFSLVDFSNLQKIINRMASSSSTKKALEWLEKTSMEIEALNLKRLGTFDRSNKKPLKI